MFTVLYALEIFIKEFLLKFEINRDIWVSSVMSVGVTINSPFGYISSEKFRNYHISFLHSSFVLRFDSFTKPR